MCSEYNLFVNRWPFWFIIRDHQRPDVAICPFSDYIIEARRGLPALSAARANDNLTDARLNSTSEPSILYISQ